MTPFGFKITLDYRSTKFEERSLACVAPEMNITRLSAENFGKMLVVTPFCVHNPPKELKNPRYYGRVLRGLERL